MNKRRTEAHKGAQLLGKRGGMTTLKKYGREKLRQWGKLGAEFGKKGGRPPKSEKATKVQARQPKAGGKE